MLGASPFAHGHFAIGMNPYIDPFTNAPLVPMPAAMPSKQRSDEYTVCGSRSTRSARTGSSDEEEDEASCWETVSTACSLNSRDRTSLLAGPPPTCSLTSSLEPQPKEILGNLQETTCSRTSSLSGCNLPSNSSKDIKDSGEHADVDVDSLLGDDLQPSSKIPPEGTCSLTSSLKEEAEAEAEAGFGTCSLTSSFVTADHGPLGGGGGPETCSHTSSVSGASKALAAGERKEQRERGRKKVRRKVPKKKSHKKKSRGRSFPVDRSLLAELKAHFRKREYDKAECLMVKYAHTTCKAIQESFATIKNVGLSLETSEDLRKGQYDSYQKSKIEMSDRLQKLQKEFEARSILPHRSVSIDVCIDTSKLQDWMIRILVYQKCGGMEPFPPWVYDSRISVPYEYEDLYNQHACV